MEKKNKVTSELTQVFGCLGAAGKERQAVWVAMGPPGTVTLLAHGSWSDGKGGTGGAAKGRDSLLQRLWHHAKHLINDTI